jgi:hypothetical protein
LLKSTGLIQLVFVGNVCQARRIHNLHQVCGVFGCILLIELSALNNIVPSSLNNIVNMLFHTTLFNAINNHEQLVHFYVCTQAKISQLVASLPSEISKPRLLA